MRERAMKDEWLIGVYAQNVLYLSIVTTQHKTKQRRLKCLLKRIKARKHAGA